MDKNKLSRVDDMWLLMAYQGVGAIPSASVYVHDTLKLAAYIALDVIGDDFSTEDVFQIYDRLQAEIKAIEANG